MYIVNLQCFMDFLNWVKRVGILNSADSFEKFVSSQQEHSSRIVVGVAVKQFEVTSATMSCLYIRNKWRESIGLTMILHVYMGIAKRQNNVTYFVWSQFKYKMAWLGLAYHFPLTLTLCPSVSTQFKLTTQHPIHV